MNNDELNLEQATEKSKRVRKKKEESSVENTPVETIEELAKAGRVVDSSQNSTPPVKTINFKYKEDGSIDWRAMIPPEYFVVNRQYFISRNKPIPETTEGLEDNQLLILLNGIKYISRIRKFYASRYPVVVSSPTHCTVVSEIEWTPANKDDDFLSEVSSGIGDATLDNTTGFGSKFLGPIAENRAFVRNVRNYLGIEVLGQDEVDNKPEQSSKTNNNASLKLITNLNDLMEKKGISFEKIKKKLVEEGNPEAAHYTNTSEIEFTDLVTLIERLQKLKDKTS